MVPAGTAHRDSKCRITSCCCLCLPIRLSLIRWKMCGSSCAATGSVIGCGKPTKPSSTLANTLGTSSCDCPSASLPACCRDQRDARIDPSPNSVSRDTDGLRPPELQHPVQDV